METVRLLSGCKINLYLRILSRRADGFHDLATLFHPLDEPHDVLTVSPGTPGSGFSFSCSRPDLENDSNIVAKTYRAFAAATGFAPDLAVRLEKTVPSGAGLGGGSANAARMLAFLNGSARGAALDADALNALAAGLGADVPFFLLNRPAWAEGIGERLAPLPPDREPLRGFSLVLVCPGVEVPTPWAFKAWDTLLERTGKIPGNRLTADVQAVKDLFCRKAVVLYNSFEDVVFQAYPELRKVKETFFIQGASGALLSGSGSSVFALFRDSGRAEEAARVFAGRGIHAFIRHPH